MRIPRWGYWLSTVGILAIGVAVLGLGDLGLLAWVIVVPSYLYVAAARSRDMGKSPWYCLTTLIPVYGWWAFLWLGIARSHAVEAEELTAEEHEPEASRQPETTQSGNQPYPWEEEPKKKPPKSILIGVGGGVLLVAAAIALIAFSMTDKESTANSNVFLKCDTWFQQQMVASPQAAANAENANVVVAYVQSQRPDSCPPDAWNPLVSNVARDHEDNIDVTFSTLPGQTRGMAVTMPAEGTPRWVYLATDSQWYSSTVGTPQISAAPPASSPLPPPTYTPRPLTTARLVPTHTTAPPHPTATSPLVTTPTPISIKDIYVAAFSSCGGQYHGQEKSRRQQAATSTLKAGLQSLDDLRTTVEQNCAGAIEAAAARLGVTPVPTATPYIPLVARQLPTPTPWRWPTGMLPTPTNFPYPSEASSNTPSEPTGIPSSDADLKQLLLRLTNEQRAAAGVPPVKMSSNRAAQLHAKAALKGCYSSHWDRWGLKPNHRYTLTGGTGADAENGSGSDYCIKASDGYSPISSMEQRVTDVVKSWMDSPGHRRNLLNPSHTELNIGIAYDRYNTVFAQHFASDYVRYSQRPTIDGNGNLTLNATVSGATLSLSDAVNIQISYDPPTKPLTRGQLSYTYALCNPTPIAYVVKPPPPGSSYTDDGIHQQTFQRKCVDPYFTSASRPTPSNLAEAHQYWAEAKSASASAPAVEIQTKRVVAQSMTVNDRSIEVKADLSHILAHYSPDIYTVRLWGRPDHMGKPTPLSKQSIFWKTRPPADAPY